MLNQNQKSFKRIIHRKKSSIKINRNQYHHQNIQKTHQQLKQLLKQRQQQIIEITKQNKILKRQLQNLKTQLNFTKHHQPNLIKETYIGRVFLQTGYSFSKSQLYMTKKKQLQEKKIFKQDNVIPAKITPIQKDIKYYIENFLKSNNSYSKEKYNRLKQLSKDQKEFSTQNSKLGMDTTFSNKLNLMLNNTKFINKFLKTSQK